MLKKFLLCFAAGLTALSLGLGIFYAGEFLVSIFQTKETVEIVETVAVEPEIIPVEELIYPKSAAVEPETEETEVENDEFNPDGYYYIIGEQKDFEDVTHFCITTNDYSKASEENNYKTVAIPPKGHIEKDKELNFTRIAVNGRKIAFETERKDGISYEFTGEFIDGEDVEVKAAKYEETYTDTALLKGTLIKKRKGKKIAESDVKLAIGGC